MPVEGNGLCYCGALKTNGTMLYTVSVGNMYAAVPVKNNGLCVVPVEYSMYTV